MNSNMYGNYGVYGNYGIPSYQQPSYIQPSYQTPYHQSMQMQQQTQQTTYLPLTFVNGVEGAKAFIVPANSTVYLKDSDSTILFEKKADQQGKYTLNAYNLVPIKDINNINKEIKEEKQVIVNGLSKEDLKPFVTINEFKAFERDIFNEIGKLSSLVEKTRSVAKNYEKRGND